MLVGEHPVQGELLVLQRRCDARSQRCRGFLDPLRLARLFGGEADQAFEIDERRPPDPHVHLLDLLATTAAALRRPRRPA